MKTEAKPKLARSASRVYDRVQQMAITYASVSYTHLRAHETVLDLVCRLLLEKKKRPGLARILSVADDNNIPFGVQLSRRVVRGTPR